MKPTDTHILYTGRTLNTLSDLCLAARNHFRTTDTPDDPDNLDSPDSPVDPRDTIHHPLALSPLNLLYGSPPLGFTTQPEVHHLPITPAEGPQSAILASADPVSE